MGLFSNNSNASNEPSTVDSRATESSYIEVAVALRFSNDVSFTAITKEQVLARGLRSNYAYRTAILAVIDKLPKFTTSVCYDLLNGLDSEGKPKHPHLPMKVQDLVLDHIEADESLRKPTEAWEFSNDPSLRPKRASVKVVAHNFDDICSI
tara:strand:+ start:2808 stop:3260 length:453 start_codon:yes stop_codon:yes gene_type:complete